MVSSATATLFIFPAAWVLDKYVSVAPGPSGRPRCGGCPRKAVGRLVDALLHVPGAARERAGGRGRHRGGAVAQDPRLRHGRLLAVPGGAGARLRRHPVRRVLGAAADGGRVVPAAPGGQRSGRRVPRHHGKPLLSDSFHHSRTMWDQGTPMWVPEPTSC